MLYLFEPIQRLYLFLLSNGIICSVIHCYEWHCDVWCCCYKLMWCRLRSVEHIQYDHLMPSAPWHFLYFSRHCSPKWTSMLQTVNIIFHSCPLDHRIVLLDLSVMEFAELTLMSGLGYPKKPRDELETLNFLEDVRLAFLTFPHLLCCISVKTFFEILIPDLFPEGWPGWHVWPLNIFF